LLCNRLFSGIICFALINARQALEYLKSPICLMRTLIFLAR